VNIKAKRARTRAHPLVVVLPKILNEFKMWDNSKDKNPKMMKKEKKSK
jgi:hypothetical protein